MAPPASPSASRGVLSPAGCGEVGRGTPTPGARMLVTEAGGERSTATGCRWGNPLGTELARSGRSHLGARRS